MKRFPAVLLALSCLFLVACGGEEPAETPAPSAEPTAAQTESTGKDREIISKGDCFEVSLDRSGEIVRYDYVVKTTDGKVIESASCPQQPRVAPLSKTLLGFRFYNEDKTWCRYYDTEKGLASPSYFGAFWDNGKLVAYNDYEKNQKLVVRDIFDDSGYKYELPIDGAAMELIVVAAVPDEAGTSLTVEYLLGESSSRLTAQLPLA